jgi:hypothetical protein
VQSKSARALVEAVAVFTNGREILLKVRDEWRMGSPFKDKIPPMILLA